MRESLPGKDKHKTVRVYGKWSIEVKKVERGGSDIEGGKTLSTGNIVPFFLFIYTADSGRIWF